MLAVIPFPRWGAEGAAAHMGQEGRDVALLSFMPALHLHVFLAEIAPGFLPGPQANRINSLHLFSCSLESHDGRKSSCGLPLLSFGFAIDLVGGQEARSFDAPGVLGPPKGLSHPGCWLQSSSASSGAAMRLCQGCRGALAAGAGGELCELL